MSELTKWEGLEADRPPLPQETCPIVDRLSVLADAISGDIGVVREGLQRSRSSIAREAGDDLLDTEANLASLRLQLEDLRTDNGQLRTSALYWRDAARDLCHCLEAIGVDEVEEWVKTADLAHLQRVALAIGGHVKELNAQLEGSSVQ